MCKISGFNVGDVFVVEKKTVDNSANWIKMIFSLVLEINYHSGLCLGVPPAIQEFSGKRQWSTFYGRFMLELAGKV